MNRYAEIKMQGYAWDVRAMSLQNSENADSFAQEYYGHTNEESLASFLMSYLLTSDRNDITAQSILELLDDWADGNCGEAE